jgi:hypothetical protein
MIKIANIFKWMIIATVALLLSCKGNNEQKSDDEILSVEFDTSMVTINYKSNEFVIPSPRQMSEIIKKFQIDYDPGFLHPSERAEDYSSTFKQSLNFGIYGTDFCYLNVYDKSEKSMDYFLALDILLKELDIKDFIDESSLKRVENNLNNSDSLLAIFSNSMNNIDKYLSQNSRDYIAVLIVTGGWIESFYLSAQSYLKRPDSELLSYIVKQKYPLDKIIKLMAPYYNTSEEYGKLVDELTDLAYEFDCIDVNYEYKEPNINETERITTINNSSVIEMNNYDLKNIAGIIKKIRLSITL